MKRKASLGLSWEDKGNYYIATLPFIPGYPVGNNTVTVEKASIVDDDWWGPNPDGWAFIMTIHVNNGETAFLATYTWGPDMEPFPTAEDAMAWVDALEPEDISQVLEDCDYTPILDGDDWSYETASRKGKHMIRRSDEKTDTRIVENEDGTYTAYCEGDKKTFDDKGKAAEWLADHFNDEYHDKADARRAARRRMMMRAAARRAAMRRKAADDDDDRKDKGFDVHYDEDGKIHVRFDDGSDMDFDDMHDFADFVEGPDADEKPVDKEEAVRARHAARVALMRRRAARVASRPVARHAMRQDDGHPYL